MCVTLWILDATAIISGRFNYSRMMTIPEILEELKDEVSRIKLELMANVRVEMAREPFISQIIEIAKETGDIHKLSDSDIRLLAKALELHKKNQICLLTDDYSIQNVALYCNIPFMSVAKKGISKGFKWEKICIGCHTAVTSGDICPVCGSKVSIRRKKNEIR